MVAVFASLVCVHYDAPWWVFVIGFLLLLLDGK